MATKKKRPPYLFMALAVLSLCLSPVAAHALFTGISGTSTAAAPTYIEGNPNAPLSLDLAGNVRTTLGTCLSGESACIALSPTSYIFVRPQPYLTYTASNTFTPVATPTDLITITGSATKTVKVWSVRIATTNTAAGSQQFFLIKRSAADTGGTPVATTGIPYDSGSATVSATVNHYTANPAALGTVVGTVNTMRVASPAAIPATWAGVREDAGVELLPLLRTGFGVQPIVLRGIAEQLAVNFNGVALVAGQTHAFTIVWSEE